MAENFFGESLKVTVPRISGVPVRSGSRPSSGAGSEDMAQVPELNPGALGGQSAPERVRGVSGQVFGRDFRTRGINTPSQFDQH